MPKETRIYVVRDLATPGSLPRLIQASYRKNVEMSVPVGARITIPKPRELYLLAVAGIKLEVTK